MGKEEWLKTEWNYKLARRTNNKEKTKEMLDGGF
jgi:hypothetical protein